MPETQHDWDAAKQGELRLQRRAVCGHVYFPPRPFCPDCSARQVSDFAASGRGTLRSYVIDVLGAPGREPPLAIAIVQLEEGPQVMTKVLDRPQTSEALVLDMPLEVAFEPLTAKTAPTRHGSIAQGK